MPRKRWNPRQYDQDDDQHESFVKIRPKPSRQKKLETVHGGFESDPATWVTGGGGPTSDGSGALFVGRVVEVHKRYVFVSPEPTEGAIATRTVFLATIAKRYLQALRDERNLVAVGDRVLCVPGSEGDHARDDLPTCVIENRAIRSSVVERLDPGTQGIRRHVLAVNVDQMLIVASYLSPPVSWGLLSRYLVLAEWNEIPAYIVLNKVDLLEQEGDSSFTQECRDRRDYLRGLGYRVIEMSADRVKDSDAAVQDVNDLLRGKLTLLSGHSGVGKSSLVNRMGPELVQVVEEDSDIFYKGRHTTSFASLIRLRNGGYVIDTPGVRSFALLPFKAIDLSHCFREMRPLLGRCRYRECSHLATPGCLVQEAVALGKIAKWRLRDYEAILTGETGREGELGADDFGYDGSDMESGGGSEE